MEEMLVSLYNSLYTQNKLGSHNAYFAFFSMQKYYVFTSDNENLNILKNYIL